MSATIHRSVQTPIYLIRPIHPFHAVMLAASLPLFLGALLSDYAYWSSYNIQWANFASWLIAGALVFCDIALLCALIGLFFRDGRSGRRLLYTLLLAATWILGLVNAFEHGKDAWAVMPTGLILSVIVTLLALIATWIGFSTLRAGVEP